MMIIVTIESWFTWIHSCLLWQNTFYLSYENLNTGFGRLPLDRVDPNNKKIILFFKFFCPMILQQHVKENFENLLMKNFRKFFFDNNVLTRNLFQNYFFLQKKFWPQKTSFCHKMDSSKPGLDLNSSKFHTIPKIIFTENQYRNLHPQHFFYC